MMGFTAEYAEGDVIVDRNELEDAAWFRRGSLPPTFSAKSIAGWMMRKFGR
jgi:NAD+ diphosphatase